MTEQTIEEPKKMGRPSDFSQEVIDVICERMANGEGLRAICRDEQLPDRVTVLRWLDKHEDFRTQYARAREALMDFYAEEIIDIAWDSSKDRYEDESGKLRNDHEVVARSRLKVDTLKFLMAKLHPRRYGDKLALEAGESAAGGPLVVRWEAIERYVVDPHAKPPEPPKLLEHNPGPLPASIDHMLLEAVIGLIRDCVPEADTRPGDDVLREVLVIAGDALRAHYAKAS